MRILFTVVTAIALVGCGNAVYSDIPTPGSGSSGGQSSSGDKPKTTKVCGVPGDQQKAGFSYLHCLPDQKGDRIPGTTYKDRSVAVGGDATIFIDSPFSTIDAVKSSDESIAHFSLITVTNPYGKGVHVDSKRAGSVTLSILSSGKVVDTITVDVRAPAEIALQRAPNGNRLSTGDEVVGFLNPLTFSQCAASSDGTRSLEGKGLVQLSREGDIGLTPNQDACGERTGGTQGDGSDVHIGANGGTLTATMGTVVKTLHFVNVDPSDVTVTLSLLPKKAHLTRPTSTTAGSSLLLSTDFSAGPLPVIDSVCEYSSTPPGLTFDGCSADWWCQVGAGSATAGRYLVNCAAADGRILGSTPVIVD